MPGPNALRQLFDLFRPSRIKASRERRREYAARFAEHQEENAKRIRRISQLRGDMNGPSDFLYDSVYGTGSAAAASRVSLPHIQETPSSSAAAGSAYRPTMMARDRTYSIISTTEVSEPSLRTTSSAPRSSSSSFSAGAGTGAFPPVSGGNFFYTAPPTYDEVAVGSRPARRGRPMSMPPPAPGQEWEGRPWRTRAPGSEGMMVMNE